LPTDRASEILARKDRIPIWAFPPSFIAIIGVGYFFTFFDITDIGYAKPAVQSQFGLTGSESLFVALAVGLVGYIAGSYLIGTVADRYGRLRTKLATLVITAVGSFGDAAATGILTLSLWRFVTGMGVGADLNLVSTYVSEISPPNRRGRISVLTFVIGIIGQAVTPFVALALVPNFTYGWRLLSVLGGVIATVAMIALADTVERKYLIFGSTVVWLAGMILVGSLGGNSAVAAGTFLGSLSLGMYLPVAYTFTAESYPTRARTSGFALSDGIGHIGGALGALALPVLVSVASFQLGFAAIGLTGLAAGLLALAGPSVKSRRLESLPR
jgi:MFS family permease